MKHGTRYAWVKRGCRCAECRLGRQREDRLRRQQRKDKVAAGLISVPHGPNGYADYACRCDVCKGFHREARLKLQRSRGVQPKRVAAPEVKAQALDLVVIHGAIKTGKLLGWSAGTVRTWAREAGINLRPDPVHGTRHGYARGCRCDACVTGAKAKRKAHHDELAARTAAGDPRVPHGTESGYGNWRCRCEPCKKAGSIANSQARERRKARLAGGSL